MLRFLAVFQLLVVATLSGPTGLVDDAFGLPILRGGRIAGGTVAARNQFPYQVLAFVELKEVQSLCGGAILSANFILSAAHCFLEFDFADLIAGIINFELDDPGYEISITPADVIRHAQHNRTTHLNDIALVRTARKPITFTASVRAVVLIPRALANTDLTGQVGRVSGWGRVNDTHTDVSSSLLFINSPIISNADCARTYGNIITASNICISGANARSTCQGDSGGPLTITYGGQQVQVGIVSFGSENGCTLGYPTAFARITSFHDWIQANTGLTIP